jgi:hypothetical protein
MFNLLFLGGLGGFEILLFIFLPLILWIWALVDCLKSEFKGSNKIVWVIVIIFFPVVGPILYFLIGRGQRL